MNHLTNKELSPQEVKDKMIEAASEYLGTIEMVAYSQGAEDEDDESPFLKGIYCAWGDIMTRLREVEI